MSISSTPERLEKAKARKLIGPDKGESIGEDKTKETTKTKPIRTVKKIAQHLTQAK